MGEEFSLNLPVKYRAQLAVYHPVDFLLTSAEKTKIPYIYRNKNNPFTKDNSLSSMVCITGPSGAGKDTLAEPLLQKGLVNFVKTATSRSRRDREKEDAYIWMRPRKKGESRKIYIKNLISEYELIEYDFHHGNLYGVHKKSLLEATQKGVALIRVDWAGVKTITQVLQGQVNVLVVFVVPDSFQQIWQRIQGRGDEIERLEEAIKHIQKAPEISHFYIHNTVNKKGFSSKAQKSLEKLIIRELG